MILDLLEEAGVLGQDKVDGCTLTTVTACTTDSVDVVLLLGWQLVVDNKTDLLDIDTSGEQVCGDKDADSTGSELLHHDFTLLLVHLTVHGCDNPVLGSHVSLQLIDSLFGVAVDDGLLNVQVGVQVEENLTLPLMLLDGDIVLADTVEGERLLLDQDHGRVSHEVLGQLENIGRHSGREEADLDV